MASYNPLKSEHLKTLDRMAKLQAKPSPSSTVPTTATATTATTTSISNTANPRKRQRSQSTQSFVEMVAAAQASIGLGSSMPRAFSNTSLASSGSLPLGLSVKNVIEHLEAHRKAWTRDELIAAIDRLDERAFDELKQNPKVEYDPSNDSYSYRAKFMGIKNVDDLLKLLKRPDHENGIPFNQLKDSYKGVDVDIRKLHEGRQVLLVTPAAPRTTITIALANAMDAAYPNTSSQIKERLYAQSHATLSDNLIVYYNNNNNHHSIKVDDEVKKMWHQLTSEVPSDPNDLSQAMRRANLKETETRDLQTQHLLEEKQHRQQLAQEQKRPKSIKIRKLTNVHLKDQYDFSTILPDN